MISSILSTASPCTAVTEAKYEVKTEAFNASVKYQKRCPLTSQPTPLLGTVIKKKRKKKTKAATFFWLTRLTCCIMRA